ncbi:MAG: biphenyl 2,3-dioxygenase [Rickettsiales bacterium]|nr:biphenyl 2,3-dioxygenase [Rickettsiales bacterium]OUV52968.1 MAG: hypothetical protein CBC87_06360 [Rickettsiales bacterium TMED127]|tara:strand:+ start:66375 stop:66791 length:417 start_codon:yes stop_codon:yes gene_type:complete
MKNLDLKKVLELLKTNSINHSVVISDPNIKDCPMVYISDEFVKQTGYSIEESLGKNCRFLQGPETDPRDIDCIRVAIKRQKSITIDILNYKKNGEKFWNRLRIRPLFDQKKKLIYFAGDQNPISLEQVRRYNFNKILD